MGIQETFLTIIGGGITAFTTFFLTKKKYNTEVKVDESTIFTNMQNSYREFVDDMNNKYEEMKKAHDEALKKYESIHQENVDLKDKVAQLQTVILQLKVVPNDLPFAFWLRDRKGIIIHISDFYDKFILQPLDIDKTELLGTRGEAFGKEKCAQLLENSLTVQRRKMTLVFNETVPGIGSGKSYKFPTLDENDKVNGSGGLWIPDDINIYQKN